MICRSQVTPLHNLAAQCNTCLFPINILFFFLLVTNFFLGILKSLSVFTFSSSIFQHISLISLTCSSTWVDFLYNSLLPRHSAVQDFDEGFAKLDVESGVYDRIDSAVQISEPGDSAVQGRRDATASAMSLQHMGKEER